MIPTFDLRNTPFKFEWSFEWRNPDVRRVLLLMLPVTISLGLINFNLLINSLFGSLVSEQAPAAIDKAFRIYQLPQGIFSVAIATVLFPTLARFASRGEIENLRATMANGMRQILFVLVPAAAAVLVLSEPMIRLVYQRGEFTPEQTTLVATALFWFAFSLPTNGLYLLQTRTFFSLQRPWMATGLAGDRPRRLRPRRPAPLQALRRRRHRRRHGIGTTAAVVAQAVILRREFGGLELGRLLGDGDQDHDRRGGPGRGLLRRLGPARQRARAWPRRPDHLARRRRWGWAAWPTWAWRSCCRIAELEQITRLCGGARCSASGRYLLGVAELGVIVGFAWLGAASVRRRLVPELDGAPAQLATAVLAIAGLLWIAEVLGTFGWFEAGPYLAAVVVVGAGTLAVGGGTAGASLRLAGFFAW